MSWLYFWNLQEISDLINRLTASGSATPADPDDQFSEIMLSFLSTAEEKVAQLQTLQIKTQDKFTSFLRYVGEKVDSADSKAIFSTIHAFLTKFDHCQQQYLEKVEADLLSPRSPTGDTARFLSAL